VEVMDYVAVTDGGKIINPQIYEQQVQGSIAQGLGYALYEEFKVSSGLPETGGLATYIIPTALDVPDILSLPVELPEETGPFGMKGVGEINLSGALPAVANAVADACGIRVTTSPLNPERVLEALSHVDTTEGGGR
ncbi:MAG: xanthine dehydrogenase family protein molybdopterin-binding subunit, partial [Chitinivibrionia bacterium]|nr:xanthine dehydrogenase family protein molybdopterin-binding subunit [Chitinivibrionia bacterium]